MFHFQLFGCDATSDRSRNHLTADDTYKALNQAFFSRNRFNLFMSVLGALILSIEIILASWLVQSVSELL